MKVISSTKERLTILITLIVNHVGKYSILHNWLETFFVLKRYATFYASFSLIPCTKVADKEWHFPNNLNRKHDKVIALNMSLNYWSKMAMRATSWLTLAVQLVIDLYDGGLQCISAMPKSSQAADSCQSIALRNHVLRGYCKSGTFWKVIYLFVSLTISIKVT